MRGRLLILLSSLALIMVVGGASAQTGNSPTRESPPVKQAAPADSPDAQGHDAQAGWPETGESKGAKTGADQTKTGVKTKDTSRPGAPTTGSNSGQ